MKQRKQSFDAEKNRTELEFYDWSAPDGEPPYSGTVYLVTTSPRMNRVLEAVAERQHAPYKQGRCLDCVIKDGDKYYWEFPRQWLRIRVPGVGFVKLWYPSRKSRRKFLATPLYPKPPDDYKLDRNEGKGKHHRRNRPEAGSSAAGA